MALPLQDKLLQRIYPTDRTYYPIVGTWLLVKGQRLHFSFPVTALTRF